MGWVLNDTLRPFYPAREYRYALYRRLDGSQDRSRQICRRQNRLPSPGFESWTFQQVASCYTNDAIQATLSTVLGPQSVMVLIA